ncbi:unnamed protein product [Arabis nemorensis]|uniref:Uncharacterized protein n=1 Tax=Arabis nemorensis TaxID=586526 RepID=A0A565BQY9_9BRAS|nr:unnamed protein product [Arabis nemorensis]
MSIHKIAPLLEANVKEHQKLHLTAGVLGGINFHLHGEAAEARVGRKENRRKALEKLRGRARESEPKSKNQKKEKDLESQVFPLIPLPLQQQAIGPVVEANLLQ